MEDFFKFLVFLLFVGSGILCWAGVCANGRRYAFWATRCLHGAGVLNALLAFTLFGLVFDENSQQGPWIGLACFVFFGGMIFLSGMFAFCGRFGSTCRRITELEEIASALSAARAHARSQTEPERIEKS